MTVFFNTVNDGHVVFDNDPRIHVTSARLDVTCCGIAWIRGDAQCIGPSEYDAYVDLPLCEDCVANPPAHWSDENP